MFCPNCGEKIPDSSKFCPQCGGKIDLDEEPNKQAENSAGSQQGGSAKHDQRNQSADSGGNSPKRLSNRTIGIIIAVAVVVVVIIVLIIALSGGGNTINLDNYVDITVTGSEGYGKATAEINKDAIIEDYSGKLKWKDNSNWENSALKLLYSDPVDALAASLSGSLDKTSGLSNGDTIHFIWSIDADDIEAQINVKLKYSDFDFKVSDLGDMNTYESTTSESTISEGASSSESMTSESAAVSESKENDEIETEKKQTTTTVLSAGDCGDNITWTWDDSNTLTISGTGAIPDYTAGSTSDNPPPWVNFKQSIQTLIIDEGITEVGDYAFSSSGIMHLSIPDSVSRIGNHAFSCSGLTDLEIPDTVTEIGEWAFSNEYLENVVIGDGIEEIPSYCFRKYNDGKSTIQSVTFGKNVKRIDDYAFYGNFGDSPNLIFTGDPPELPDDGQAYHWDGKHTILYSSEGMILYYPQNNPLWVESGFFTYWSGDVVGY